MTDSITVQYGVDGPSEVDFQRWAEGALPEQPPREFTIRIVDETEGAELNQRWRNKPGPTNVLSFPAGMDDYLGDIVICAPVVEREAVEQGKTPEAHWAHLTVHGLLHLCGYDHQTDAEATEMERLETELLQKLGYPDPYQ